MTSAAPSNDPHVPRLLGDVDMEQVRKVAQLGAAAWPYAFDANADIGALRAELDAKFQPGQQDNSPTGKRYKVAGRLRAKRGSGGIAFLVVEGQSARIQAIVEKTTVGEGPFAEALHLLNEGDFVGIEGFGMKSKRGEASLGAEQVHLLAKSLVSFADLGDAENPELRYGKPYIGLMQGTAARATFIQRAKITQVVRHELEGQGFLEATIPVLEKVYGGANAKPFTTHSNAKDNTMYLRISHELALKKLLVGGLEKVYHIGPAFRNEDIDTTHNPEFTLMECYAAYWDYHHMMRLTETCFEKAVTAIHGKPQITKPDGTVLHFTAPFARITMKDAIRTHGGPDPDKATDKEIQAILAQHHVTIRGGYTRGLGIAKLFEVFAEPKLVQPTFVIDHPRETTPLCKQHRSDPSLVERFELFIDGREHANAYSELNDPLLQAKLFEDQEARRAGGDDEAQPTDTDFLDAIKRGMPPAGGLGIGIDRMVMTILGVASIKQVLAFPQVK